MYFCAMYEMCVVSCVVSHKTVMRFISDILLYIACAMLHTLSKNQMYLYYFCIIFFVALKIVYLLMYYVNDAIKINLVRPTMSSNFLYFPSFSLIFLNTYVKHFLCYSAAINKMNHMFDVGTFTNFTLMNVNEIEYNI